MAVSSPHTLNAIAQNQVVFAGGDERPYRCPIDSHCRLGSALVIPLKGEGDLVVGTINLYEPKTRLFSNINRTLGEGIGRLLSSQLLAGNYERQKQLLAQSEIKLLQAQINPHFLFNALNTLSAVIRVRPRPCPAASAAFVEVLPQEPENAPATRCRSAKKSNTSTPICRSNWRGFAGKLDVAYDIPTRVDVGADCRRSRCSRSSKTRSSTAPRIR